ncbi:Acetyl-/propionyl-coenzyme A carboxylase alpha chain [Includes: Biotin carboxylase and Biotin carboxyl carrier protein (BCCP)] [Frankia alni ACN14a]|uniref:Biotin-dependent 3-methylcrotonyl-coenzyme A carboxylase alpha1 subunit n=1 Tax=Frankia alni (strain DSM 45986 / CECT 9034 / ACN14a) TaxID=326424 RepID=Q0RL02_FRAAA|nr:Acetyl-/propionyl-coenzyme A carboxylase alpha chain [Includes: Biotin carboxylase and Biotin carboxyl carrier protein (BCCP)] [Frankia alni ACN14a]
MANRGEIAVRVIRTLRELGIESVAVYSDADAGARHVREADVAVRIGPAPARESYLNIPAVLAAATSTGAQAIHPGYGFLSENAEFAAACTEAGIVFIGPPTRAVEVMGDKITARRAVAAAGVPVVPGRDDPAMTDADLLAAADQVGYPVLLKPSAGGGGKGMRVVTDASRLAAEVVGARREAAAAFGDDTLFVERYVQTPRHIEVQVLADAHGTVVHLGERECSLQRRHQKVIEEAPSVLLTPQARERMGAAAVATAASVGYVGAGTVEFLVAAANPEEFFFLEMNTRLQVEHPVTELVTGLDLVAEQLRIAAGEPLGYTQADIRLTGHAVEARVYAEDAARGFLPTGGQVLRLDEPSGPAVRVDSGLRLGTTVGSTYDPMLAKIIAHGPDRDTALDRLDRALARTCVLGVTTNVGFLRALLEHPDTRAGRLDTGLIERDLDALVAAAPGAADVPAVYALVRLLELTPDTPFVDPWDVPSGWRPGEHSSLHWTITAAGLAGPVEVGVRGTPADALVAVDGGEPIPAAVEWADAPAGERASRLAAGGELVVTLAGRTRRWRVVADGATLWLGADGAAWPVSEHRRRSAAAAVEAGGEARSPMPGTVIAVHAAAGDEVAAGTPLVVVEAMKMEHTVGAPVAGRVKDVLVGVGEQVTLDAVLAVVDPAPVALSTPVAP